VLQANESIYIHVGEKHQLRNEGAGELEIIEVQTGNYFGEDDIVRY
jgi:mannose-6-phosphate isomerase-like protein (cupin superfamily)